MLPPERVRESATKRLKVRGSSKAKRPDALLWFAPLFSLQPMGPQTSFETSWGPQQIKLQHYLLWILFLCKKGTDCKSTPGYFSGTEMMALCLVHFLKDTFIRVAFVNSLSICITGFHLISKIIKEGASWPLELGRVYKEVLSLKECQHVQIHYCLVEA